MCYDSYILALYLPSLIIDIGRQYLSFISCFLFGLEAVPSLLQSLADLMTDDLGPDAYLCAQPYW